MDKKYYWLKLDRNFFKRHDIRIIKAQTNGKDYIIFYLMLLLESVDHEGHLRFNDMIPYDENMLSVITDTNVDIVRAAIKLFKNLGLMEVFDDGTIYMNETNKMLGAETEWAIKKREYREKLLIENKDTTRTKKDNVRQELEIEKELELDIEKDKDINHRATPRKRFVAPSVEEVESYCLERNNNINAEAFIDHYTTNGWKQNGGKPIVDWKAAVRTWEHRRKEDKPLTPQQLKDQRKEEMIRRTMNKYEQ